MRAVILGGAGHLGQELARQLPGAVVLSRRDVDVTDAVRLRDTLSRSGAEIVFNATSNNRVDAGESDPAPLFAVNAVAVRDMARACRDFGCPFVHFSTNYVFGRDLDRKRPYLETDLPGPINVYGVSKLMGEELALLTWPGTLVVRTASLVGCSPHTRHNFLENMLAKARRGEMVRVVDDQTVAPTRTVDLAAGAIALAARGATGVFHLNGPEPATWHDLAREYFHLAGVADRLAPATTSEIAAPAPRPRFSVLSIDKYLSSGLPAPMPWREAVQWLWNLITPAPSQDSA